MLVPALRGFFHFLLREDVVAANPARGTRTPDLPHAPDSPSQP
jgi:site-specific recombinase XerC